MSIRLLVTSQDGQLEKVLMFLRELNPETSQQLLLIDKAAQWLKASQPINYGITNDPKDISTLLVFDDSRQSTLMPETNTQPPLRENSLHSLHTMKS